MGTKYDIGAQPAPLSREVVALLADCETATIGHWRLWGFCNSAIQPVLRHRRIAGRAITLALPGPCSTLLHYVMDHIEPGDVLLIDRLGDQQYACWGGGLTHSFKAAGGVAAVIDGPCADRVQIVDCDIPVWSRGVASITTRLLDLGGRLNRPVSVGGGVVCPGDAVICDDSGVLVLPPHEAEQEARRAPASQKDGKAIEARLAGGESLPSLSGARSMVEADQSLG